MNGKNKRWAEMRWDAIQQAHAAEKASKPKRERVAARIKLPGVFADSCDLVADGTLTRKKAAGICGLKLPTWTAHYYKYMDNKAQQGDKEDKNA